MPDMDDLIFLEKQRRRAKRLVFLHWILFLIPVIVAGFMLISGSYFLGSMNFLVGAMNWKFLCESVDDYKRIKTMKWKAIRIVAWEELKNGRQKPGNAERDEKTE